MAAKEELQAAGELRAAGGLPVGEAQCEAQNCTKMFNFSTVAEYIELMKSYNVLVHGVMAAVNGGHPRGHGGRGRR